MSDRKEEIARIASASGFDKFAYGLEAVIILFNVLRATRIAKAHGIMADELTEQDGINFLRAALSYREAGEKPEVIIRKATDDVFLPRFNVEDTAVINGLVDRILLGPDGKTSNFDTLGMLVREVNHSKFDD